MPIRNFKNNAKSLLHFDFPYFAEQNDGLRDEISSEKWTRNNVKFVGQEIPNDEIVSDCPKFGYRCPQFSGSSSFISATNTTGIFSLSATGNYEFGFFLRVTSNTAGRVLALKNSSGNYSFAFSITSDGKFTLGGQTSSQSISLNTWTYIIIRITNNKFYAYMNGTQIMTGNFSGAECSSLELGGFIGQIDEFIFRHGALASVQVPTQPEQAIAEIKSFGGFGDGKHSRWHLGSTEKINSYAIIKSANGKNIVINSWTNGAIASKSLAPTVGDEVMIHVSQSKGTNFSYLGNFAFRKIAAINGNTITLDSEINEFPLASILANYYVQIITVPNFETLTLDYGETINIKHGLIPLQYSKTTGGGIIALRASNSLTVNGYITTSGYGPARNDTLQLTHADMINNFVLGSGGCVFIAAKNFTATSTARIGGTWDGSQKGGVASPKSRGSSGGAGYGGSGGSDIDNGGLGGNGGVGGGGGGGDSIYGGNAGSPGKSKSDGILGALGTGGGGRSSGGTQGINGGNGQNDSYSSGGGGAGGNGGNSTDSRGGYAGSNVIIIAEKFSCEQSAISTGGECGAFGYNAAGGGGSGLCYIAAKEMI